MFADGAIGVVADDGGIAIARHEERSALGAELTLHLEFTTERVI